MQSSHRIGLIVAAVVVLIVAFVVLGGGEDNTATTPTTPPAAETTGGEQAPEEAAPEPEPEPAPRVERIRVPVSDPKTLRYERGDTIRLRVTAAEGDVTEIHVHGYDKELAVPAGETKTLTFKANLEGIFEVEDHHSGAPLAELEVRPS